MYEVHLISLFAKEFQVLELKIKTFQPLCNIFGAFGASKKKQRNKFYQKIFKESGDEMN